MARPPLLLTDGRASNLREAAAAGALDFEYTAVLEALFEEDGMPAARGTKH